MTLTTTVITLGRIFRWGTSYPLETSAQGFYEGMAGERAKEYRQPSPLRLGRQSTLWCAGLVGDIDSSFESLRNQLAAGLNMGLAGIPWWTTDIGGFHGGVNSDHLS